MVIINEVYVGDLDTSQNCVDPGFTLLLKWNPGSLINPTMAVPRSVQV